MYPMARAMQRTVHAHVGPTNSGKTHAALEALRNGRSGVYGGPLRLLAWEIHDRLNGERVPCTLRTGQEVRDVAGAAHTACTIEMCSVSHSVDVAVLDEIQMLQHAERGWAWSRALLGLPARSLHVCGSPDALPLVRSLVHDCGDELVVHEYQRLTPLEIERHTLGGDLSNVRPGDVVVAFSRREIFDLKRRVEATSGLVCGVVYGSLPPDTRRTQAALFNDPNSREQVLVASDAVGMGLNLNIARIIFSTLSKFDGVTTRPLHPPEVKQIAGRAGRYASRFSQGGLVTCLDHEDAPALAAALGAADTPLTQAGLAPTFEQLDLFDRASQRSLPYADLLRAFEDAARVDPRYFCCLLEPAVRLAEVIHSARLTLYQRHAFCNAPLDAKDDLHSVCLLQWAKDVAKGNRARLRYAPPTRAPENHDELKTLESYFRVLDGYLWLAQRFPESFAHAEKAVAYRDTCAQFIDGALHELSDFDCELPHGFSSGFSSGKAKAATRRRGGRRGGGGGRISGNKAAEKRARKLIKTVQKAVRRA